MKKKVLAVVLAMSMVCSMVACSSSADKTSAGDSNTEVAADVQSENGDSTTTSGIKDSLVIAGADDPTDMSPWAGSVSGVVGLIYMVYESLFIEEHGGEMDLCLAKEYTQDGNTLTVTLFDNIYDSEGNHFTASDVVFSLDKCIELGNVTYVRIIDSYEATDDTTVVLTLKDKLVVGDLETFLTNVYMVTQAAYEVSSDGMFSQPVGTGRYAVTEFSPDSKVVFELRDEYWQTDETYISSRSAANVNKIVYDYVADSSQRAIAAENGTADVAMSISYNDMNIINDSTNVTSYAYQTALTKILLANCSESSPCNDINVRNAIFYALNNEGLASTYTEGTAIPVYDMSNSNFSDYYEDYYKELAEDGNIYSYDTTAAAQYLSDAGYASGELTLTLITDSSTAHSDLATVIQAYLLEIGINVEIETYQNNLLTEYAENEAGWDLYLRQTASNSYATVAWSRPLLASNYSTGGTCNFIFDDTLQEKLNTVITEEGHTEENVKDAYSYIVDNAYGMGLFCTEGYIAIPNTVEYVSMNASLMPSFSSFIFTE